MLFIHLLGHPRFLLDGATYRASLPASTLGLPGYLTLAQEGPLDRASVAYSLWPDDDEDVALAKLRRHIYTLQRALPAIDGIRWVSADETSVQWNRSSPSRVDAVEFERLSAAPETRAQAAALYGGDLLAPLYDDWIFPLRERLRTRQLANLHELIAAARAARDVGQAIEYARTALALDPWREDVVRHLIAARFDSGDRAGALHEYDQFAKRLRAELDVEPMPETSALFESIRRGDRCAVGDDLENPAADRPSERHVKVMLPFVGRSAEFEMLRQAWSRAARGRGQTVFVAGEAGIGKTRLVTELALLGQSQGGRALVGGTSSPEATPYQSLVDALRSALPLVTSLDLPPASARALGALLPEAFPESAELRESQGGDRERLRLFQALAQTLSALSSPRPVMLILEDMHWAGQATIDALERLARAASSAALLVVATYREEEAPLMHPLREARRRLLRDNLAHHVTLSRLTAEDVRALVDAVPALHGDPEIARRAFALSEGNALFAEHVIAGAVEKGVDAAGAPTLRTALAARASRLSERALGLAQCAAVAGASFDADLVGAIGGESADDTYAGLDELRARGIIRETARRNQFDFAFSHHLLHETIYEGIDPKRRSQLHLRAGRLLVPALRDRPALARNIALHFDRGGDAEHAARAYAVAARYAYSVHALADADAAAARALELAEDSRVRFEALCVSASVEERLGRAARLDEVLELLDREAALLGDDDAECEAIVRRIRAARRAGDRTREGALVADLSERSKKMGSLARQAQAASHEAAYLVLMGRNAEGKARAEAASVFYREAGDAYGEVESLCLLAEIAPPLVDEADARRMLDDATAAAERSGDVSLRVRALTAASLAYMVQQRYSRCLAASREAADIYRALGDREGEADVTVRAASCLARLSDFAGARSAFTEAQRLYAGIGKVLGIATVQVNMGVLAGRLGLLEESKLAFATVRPMFASLNDTRGAVVCDLNDSFVALAEGDAEAAHRAATSALAGARKIGHVLLEAAAYANLGCALWDLGRLEEAIELMRKGLAIREQHGVTDILMDRADLALALLRQGDKAGACAVADAIAASDASPESEGTYWPHYPQWIAARAYRAARRDGDAADRLARAWKLWHAFAARLPDERTRDAFASLPASRQLRATVETGTWPVDGAKAGRRRADAGRTAVK